MTRSLSSSTPQFSDDAVIWTSLKRAIAASSGFQRWQQEQGSDATPLGVNDQSIRRYLRETLETLAY